jgi:asparagine synthase (glutamine-hydrolysing)
LTVFSKGPRLRHRAFSLLKDMCGIAGIVRFDGGGVECSEIHALTQYVNHRGPDAVGAWVSANGCIALGHARLSILDLRPEAGQPMVSSHGRHVIVFNGEIYNFVEIAGVLRGEGYTFRTGTDTEVILCAYDCWGLDMFPRFNGMWAMALADTATGQVVFSRDRFGIKPLYYHLTPQRLVFASEVQAIQRFLPGEVSPDPVFIARFLAYDVSAYGDEATCLREVRAIQPGFHARVLPDGRMDSRQWYWLAPQHVPSRFEDQALGLRDLLTDACRLRLRSDLPVATCLSGGVDSGSIVSLLATMPKVADGRFAACSHRSFTAAFPGTELDETAAVRHLAEMKGLSLDVNVIECPSPGELERALQGCDGPMPAMAFFPIWQLYRRIKQQGISVTLDGQGADEMLGGYYLGYDALRGAWQVRRPWWFRDLYRTYGAIHPKASRWIRGDLSAALRLGCAEVDQACKRPLKKLLRAMGRYEPKPSKMPNILPPPPWVPQDHRLRENALALALWRQFFVNPLPFLLHQYDRCSMASGVECRMPFMDYRVVEYVFSLPLESRIGGGLTKRVLREAVRGFLPDSIRLNRHKTGFNAPFSNWLHGPLKEWVLDTSASRGFLDNPFFDGRGLASSIRKALESNGESLSEQRIWPALHLAWWMGQPGQCSPSSPNHSPETNAQRRLPFGR